MLIKFDKSVANYLESITSDIAIHDNVVMLVYDALSLVYKNNHVLLLDRYSIGVFKKCESIQSKYNSVVIRNIEKNLNDIVQVKKEINRIIVFYIDEYELENNAIYIQIKKDTKIEAALLIAENSKDGEFFFEISSKILHSKKLGNFKINLSIIHGGGCDTPNQYERYSNEQRMCICIVDSDKYFTDDEFGLTAKKLIETHKLISNPASNYYILNVKEKENLISPIMYLHSNCINTHIQSFAKLDETKNQEILSFMPFFKGLSVKKYRNLSIQAKEQYNRLLTLIDESRLLEIPFDKIDKPYTKPTAWLYYVNISDMASVFLTSIKTNNSKLRFGEHETMIENNEIQFPGYLSKEWSRIFEEIFSYGISFSSLLNNI